jgi:thioredoxin-like negative regulator of GroEL
MVPVLEAIGERFEGRVSVVLIDVDKDPGQLDRFNTEYTPTQIFFNAEEKEVYHRHVVASWRKRI